MVDGTSPPPADVLEELGQYGQSMIPRATFVAAQESSRSSVDLFRLPLLEDLRRSFLETDIENLQSFTSKAAIEYFSSRSLPDGHVMWKSTEEVGLLKTLDVEEDVSRAIPLFEEKLISARNLKMTITTNSTDSPDQEVISLYRVTRNTARLAKAKGFAAVLRNGTFESLDEEVLLFNRDVDAISFRGYIFFLKPSVIERAFGFIDDLKRQANRTFESVAKVLRIEGVEGFQRAVTSDINMMAKMASIKRKIDSNPGYSKAMNIENLLRFIDANPQIEVETIGTGKDRRLVFNNSPKTRYKILKLLDDDFLTSELTELDYLVDSKGDPMNG